MRNSMTVTSDESIMILSRLLLHIIQLNHSWRLHLKPCKNLLSFQCKEFCDFQVIRVLSYIVFIFFWLSLKWYFVCLRELVNVYVMLRRIDTGHYDSHFTPGFAMLRKECINNYDLNYLMFLSMQKNMVVLSIWIVHL